VRYEITRYPKVKALLKNRWLQLAIFGLLLAGFLFAILAGFVGTPVGNRNFSIIFVWIAWWALLILVLVPVLGRGWCAICPIPLPGEWLQRGAILDPPDKKPRWLNWRWPNRLRNIWLQNATFTLVALFSTAILTTPQVTALVLAGMLCMSFALSLIYERRAFCRYLCPVGGFIGLYAQAAPIELRVKSTSACATCSDKPCYNGSEAGYGCPWQTFPGGLSKNNACGLCLECLRTCPKDNIAINLRPIGADLSRPSRRMDEAFKAFIMLGAALVYAAVLLGPWGALKDAAYQVGTTAWMGYAAGFLALIFLILPAAFWLAVSLSRKRVRLNDKANKQLFAQFATALVPLGLVFWAAFSLSFVLANASYILAALSDPLGWGWNLFGTAGVSWQPVLTSLIPALQIVILAGGLFWSVRTAQKAGLETGASPLPVAGFCLVTTLLMLGLLV